MAEHTAPGDFLEQLAARNYQRLAATLASAVRARMLLPGGPEEHRGRAAIVRRLESWSGSASELGLTSSSGSNQEVFQK
jgi:hypothetical protein